MVDYDSQKNDDYIETWIVKWGLNHKKIFKDAKKAYSFAYNKSFYFDTLVNDSKFTRTF